MFPRFVRSSASQATWGFVCKPKWIPWSKWQAGSFATILAGGLMYGAYAESAVAELDTSKLRCQWDSSKPKESIHKPVVVVACGSFNPPTIMHLRMFELARDALKQKGYDPLGGYMSPVNDGYGKKDLASAEHRLKMCELATSSSDMIMVDHWEATGTAYKRTRAVLERVEQNLKEAFDDGSPSTPTKVMLLCGSDLLESLCVPGVWKPPDVKHILEHHGIVCLARSGSDAVKLINDEKSCLYEFRDKIIVMEDPVDNAISSKVIRECLREGRSVRYIVPESVVEYMKKNELYKA
ncbi:hypothetical protein BSKO_02268 [Bryopsis sp. KO-2023]|nr:hypothetical protein BSKO_02268 [Bryopsis sp. KO-2023]